MVTLRVHSKETYLALSGGDKWGGIGELSVPKAGPRCAQVLARLGARTPATTAPGCANRAPTVGGRDCQAICQ